MTVLPLSVTRNWSVLSLCSTPRSPSGPAPRITEDNVNSSSRAAILREPTEGRAPFPQASRLVSREWMREGAGVSQSRNPLSQPATSGGPKERTERRTPSGGRGLEFAARLRLPRPRLLRVSDVLLEGMGRARPGNGVCLVSCLLRAAKRMDFRGWSLGSGIGRI